MFEISDIRRMPVTTMNRFHDVDAGKECAICSREELSVVVFSSLPPSLRLPPPLPHSNGDKLHEKLQLIFNKYIAANITSVERWRRASWRDVPRLAYSKRPEAPGQRLIVACGP